MEIWKDIKGFENIYRVSNTGKVLNVKFNRQLKPGIVKGYVRVCLYKNNKNTYKTVHRLVAEAFLIKPNNDCEVNHKDSNKKNNNVDNLEWITHKENMSHFYKSENTNLSPVIQINDKDEVLNYYFSIIDAANCNKTTTNTIWTICNNNRKKGILKNWVFLSEYNKYLKEIEQSILNY